MAKGFVRRGKYGMAWWWGTQNAVGKGAAPTEGTMKANRQKR